MSRTAWIIVGLLAAILLVGGTVLVLRSRGMGSNIPLIGALVSGGTQPAAPKYDPPTRFVKTTAVSSTAVSPPVSTSTSILQPIELPSTLTESR